MENKHTGRKLIRISQPQYAKVCDWFAENKANLEQQKFASMDVVTSHVVSQVGFPISPTTVRDIAKLKGVKLTIVPTAAVRAVPQDLISRLERLQRQFDLLFTYSIPRLNAEQIAKINAAGAN